MRRAALFVFVACLLGAAACRSAAAAEVSGELKPQTLNPGSPSPGPAPELTSRVPSLRIIEIYPEGGSTHLIIQSVQPLVVGRSLYAGNSETPITINVLLSKREGASYYAASTPGKPALSISDVLRLEKTRKTSLPAALMDSLKASYGFEQKSVAEVTAVQSDRALIDKGTLHEVHERDLYRIYDASGAFKGTLEVRGIGDFQSSGRLDISKAASPGPETGDYAVFIGQRRLFGLGLEFGSRLKQDAVVTSKDSSAGGGLLWSMTFYNGLGLEALFGYYGRDGKGSMTTNRYLPSERGDIDERSAKFIMPIWLKKNVLYPSLVSPFVAAGAYWFEGKHVHEIDGPLSAPIAREEKSKHGVFPVVGVGLEFFPTRFFRPRLEVRHFFAPDVTALGDVFHARSTYYCLGVLTSW